VRLGCLTACLIAHQYCPCMRLSSYTSSEQNVQDYILPFKHFKHIFLQRATKNVSTFNKLFFAGNMCIITYLIILETIGSLTSNGWVVGAKHSFWHFKHIFLYRATENSNLLFLYGNMCLFTYFIILDTLGSFHLSW
jgi:hypothetical protein